MSQALKITKITKYFDDFLVFDEVDLAIKQGEIVGFIGLNGVGKTTLIKIILNLLDKDFGEVEIFGVNNILPNSRQDVFYLPEKFSPSPYLTGEEFLHFVLDFHGLKPQEARLQELCNHFEFSFANLKNKVTKYSKGTTQKLGLIAAFMSNANLIILDEPMSGLDVAARIKLKQALISCKNAGKTIFFSSHILLDIEEICDEIAILHDKKIIFSGKVQNFISNQQKQSLEDAFLKAIGE